MTRRNRKATKKEAPVREKSITEKATEQAVDYANRLRLVEEHIKELKGQINKLETKKVGLQGAIIALSHILENKENDNG